MEHLFLEVEDIVFATETADAANAIMLRDDRAGHKESLVSPVPPFTKWLGFDHDGSSDPSFSLPRDLALYPVTRGWNVELMWDKGDLRQGHAAFDDQTDPAFIGKQVAAMLQSWLYFGFLESIIGKPVHTSYFLRYDIVGNRYIHSGNLGFALMAWKVAGWRATEAERLEMLDNSLRNFDVVNSAVQRLLAWTDSGTENGEWTRTNFPGYCELVIHITPAIIRLFDTISTTRDQIQAVHGSRILVLNGLTDSRSEREARLMERGWCPFLIRYCQSSLHDSVLDWVDASRKINHSGDHSMCTGQECTRNNIDIKTYETQHSSSCADPGNCCFIAPEIGKVFDIIDEGRIPVIVVKTGDSSDMEVIAHDPEVEGNYIAISHVWADGLGSTSEKGLPSCQIKRLAKLLSYRTGLVEISFWIDSMCIPSAPKQRSSAIGLMRSVYRQARSVIVIDKTIRQCSHDSSVEDILWAVHSSSWMQRLWTFQESFLARELLFEMANNELLPHDQDFPPSKVISPLQVIYTAFTQHLHSIRPNKGLAEREPRTNLGEVAAALSWRSTSRRSDEVLAIAALFNIDSKKLATLPPEQRMKEFYLMVSKLPHDIIFFDGDKLLMAPFRWAPKTLMSRSAISLDPCVEGQTAKATSEGLHGQYEVFCLNRDLRGGHGAQSFVHETTNQSIYGISWEKSYQNQPRATFSAVIIREVQGGTYLKPGIGRVIEGIAIRIKSKGAGTHFCDYMGRVTVLEYDKEDSMAPPQTEIPKLPTAQWKTMALCIT
ncbi:hypothetical protein BP6252_10247 [Coleophoma cylindrospora]|uniref:Heterokaryon incompatibility domain-containing protein n=1 Tax=Coleophoma cylindrospora TaxID=1849047 RepID=A0A3D8QRZ2_9HELO|nr:hypothetical protein BP6252_10247 [Coleophoma cylindrospora]